MEDLRKSAGLASLYGVTRGDSAHLQAWSISHTCSMYEALPGKEEEVCQSPMALHNLPYITMGPSYAFTQAVRLRGRVSLPLCPSGPPDLKPWLFSYNFFKNITTEEMSPWARSLSLLHWHSSAHSVGSCRPSYWQAFCWVFPAPETGCLCWCSGPRTRKDSGLWDWTLGTHWIILAHRLLL